MNKVLVLLGTKGERKNKDKDKAAQATCCEPGQININQYGLKRGLKSLLHIYTHNHNKLQTKKLFLFTFTHSNCELKRKKDDEKQKERKEKAKHAQG